ncbi:oleate hydratase [Bradyrhizobium septentrionale]|uniref:Oleate hydratase n=1 Tax=Bradyrhizobium septentrionale TaxID=1404411 RepID=A0ABZ2NWD3_9BRAD
MWWGYGLYPDMSGNFVHKPMSECTGREILIELLSHLSIGPLIAVCCQAYISELAHGTEVVLAPSELVRVAETARARLIRALPARHWIAGAG